MTENNDSSNTASQSVDTAMSTLEAAIKDRKTSTGADVVAEFNKQQNEAHIRNSVGILEKGFDYLQRLEIETRKLEKPSLVLINTKTNEEVTFRTKDESGKLNKAREKYSKFKRTFATAYKESSKANLDKVVQSMPSSN